MAKSESTVANLKRDVYECIDRKTGEKKQYISVHIDEFLKNPDKYPLVMPEAEERLTNILADEVLRQMELRLPRRKRGDNLCLNITPIHGMKSLTMK